MMIVAGILLILGALSVSIIKDKKNPDLAQFLNHPQIIKEEKKKVVEAIFSGKLSDGLLGFLVTVIEKGRQNDMIPICDYFTDRVKAYKKIGVVDPVYFTAVILLIVVSSVATPLVLKVLFTKAPPTPHPSQSEA